MLEGILILGHGSRQSDANDDVKTVASMVQKELAGAVVQAAFLSFEQPDLKKGIAGLVEAGTTKITVVPLFLFGGNHVKHDIPETIASERQKYPDIEFRYSGYLGPDRRIAEIVLDRIRGE